MARAAVSKMTDERWATWGVTKGAGDPTAIAGTAKALREWRKNEGLTQREVAVRLRITIQSFRRWERGESSMPAWVYYRLKMIDEDISLDEIIGFG